MNTQIMEALDSERAYQEKKYPGHRHSTGEWLLIMEKCLADAKAAWNCGHGDGSVMDEIRQVTAVGVAALEQCGSPLRVERVPVPSGEKQWRALQGAVDPPAPTGFSGIDPVKEP